MKIEARVVDAPPEKVLSPVTPSVEERVAAPVTPKVPPTFALFETVRAEVEAFVVTARKVVVAFVVVDLDAVSPPLKSCSPVQVFLFPKFKDATTSPDVGEIVKEPSMFETEVTVPVTQVPDEFWKQPLERRIPFENVDVATAEVTFKTVV